MQLSSVKPPSIHIQEKVGPQIESLGGQISTVNIDEVEVRFKDPKVVEVANGTFEDTIDGIKLRYTDSAGNGVRGVLGGYEALDVISRMEGVTEAMALETFPLQLSITTKPDAKAAVDLLLRAESAFDELIRVG